MLKLDGITVLMAINKIDLYYKDAIYSILNQTRKPDEIIIVVNGEDRVELKEQIALLNISELIILESEIGQLALALNIGLNAAHYEFIARMDSDDIAEPTRLEKQLNALLTNDLDLIGSSAYLIDSQNKKIGARQALTDIDIKKNISFKNVFCHPSVMFRRTSIIAARGYNSGFNSEDYDLWIRLSKLGIRWNNLSEPLLNYRIHNTESQGSRLAYAECCGIAMREFMLKKSWHNLKALIIHIMKALYR